MIFPKTFPSHPRYLGEGRRAFLYQDLSQRTQEHPVLPLDRSLSRLPRYLRPRKPVLDRHVLSHLLSRARNQVKLRKGRLLPGTHMHRNNHSNRNRPLFNLQINLLCIEALPRIMPHRQHHRQAIAMLQPPRLLKTSPIKPPWELVVDRDRRPTIRMLHNRITTPNIGTLQAIKRQRHPCNSHPLPHDRHNQDLHKVLRKARGRVQLSRNEATPNLLLLNTVSLLSVKLTLR